MESQKQIAGNGGGVKPTGVATTSTTEDSWANYVPPRFAHEDCLSEELAAQVWAQIYKAAGHPSGSEQDKKSIRCGVYTYCAINGCSKEGDFLLNVECSNGASFPASVVLKASSGRVRKLLRVSMNESYKFLKESHALERDDRFISKRNAFGVAAETAFATVDWLDYCPLFTKVEEEAHNTYFNVAASRARRARGGKDVDQLAAERIEAGLDAQGPEVSAPSGSPFQF